MTGQPPGREQLLRAALRAVAVHGQKGATVRSIAEAAGVTNGLIVHHFGTKERLFAEVDALVLERFGAAMALPPEDIEPAVATASVSARLADVIGTDPDLRAYVRRGILEGTESGTALFHQLVDTTSALLERLDPRTYRRGADREWTATQIVAINLAGVLFEPMLRGGGEPFSAAGVRRRSAANRAFISAALGLEA